MKTIVLYWMKILDLVYSKYCALIDCLEPDSEAKEELGGHNLHQSDWGKVLSILMYHRAAYGSQEAKAVCSPRTDLYPTPTPTPTPHPHLHHHHHPTVTDRHPVLPDWKPQGQLGRHIAINSSLSLQCLPPPWMYICKNTSPTTCPPTHTHTQSTNSTNCKPLTCYNIYSMWPLLNAFGCHSSPQTTHRSGCACHFSFTPFNVSLGLRPYLDVVKNRFKEEPWTQ